jgi:hypothetical protein
MPALRWYFRSGRRRRNSTAGFYKRYRSALGIVTIDTERSHGGDADAYSEQSRRVQPAARVANAKWEPNSRIRDECNGPNAFDFLRQSRNAAPAKRFRCGLFLLFDSRANAATA